MLHCVFGLFFFVLCCQFLWIVEFWLPLLYYLTCIKCAIPEKIIIASDFQSKMNLKNIDNLVYFLLARHWSPSKTNIGRSRPEWDHIYYKHDHQTQHNTLWIHIPVFWRVQIFFLNNNIGKKYPHVSNIRDNYSVIVQLLCKVLLKLNDVKCISVSKCQNSG